MNIIAFNDHFLDLILSRPPYYTPMTRRKQTIPEIYSYYSREFNVLCVPDKWNLYSLVVYKNNEEIERIDDMVSGELHDHLERLKTKYICGHSELPAYKTGK
jgi:hypothetical protein